jgi:hypothetical protein
VFVIGIFIEVVMVNFQLLVFRGCSCVWSVNILSVMYERRIKWKRKTEKLDKIKINLFLINTDTNNLSELRYGVRHEMTFRPHLNFGRLDFEKLSCASFFHQTHKIFVYLNVRNSDCESASAEQRYEQNKLGQKY